MVEDDITLMLQRLARGDAGAADELLRLVYDELRRLAAAKMSRETRDQTLQPTALVHEVWLRLGGNEQPLWVNRAHFFGAAAEAMCRILIDTARRKQALRRGGAMVRATNDELDLQIAAPVGDPDELLLVHEALDAFTAHDARCAELVKLKYFAGVTLEEAAEILGISGRTAKRDWSYARAWLFNEVQRQRAK